MSEKNTLIARGFDDIEELQITQDKFGIVLIKGAAYRDNVGYKISIKRTADTWVEEHERKKRKPLYTGTISILDPASSHVMLSNAKKERKNKNGKTFKNKDIYASIKFECDSADEGKIACILTRQIDTLFNGNKGQLKDAAKKMMLPDHLTPQSAAGQYSNEFLRLYYSESSSENNEERQNKIAKTLSVLPCVPICKLKAREVSAFFDDNNVTTANRELCSHFFDFLIATEKCAGKNPIITSDSKETSTNAILRAAFSQQGLGSAVFTKMFELIKHVKEQNSIRIPTGRLNEVLAYATQRVQPPSDKGRRLKIYYMTQVSTNPPTFVFFVNRADLFHFSYQRYLENQIRETFELDGTPIVFKIRERDRDDVK